MTEHQSRFRQSALDNKIATLLAMSEDPALSKEHRTTCAAKAAALMTKQGIDDAQAAADGVAREQAELWPYAVAGTHGFGPARAAAAERIAAAMGCKAISQHNPSPRPCIVAVIGTPADLGALRRLLPPVMRQADLAAATAAALGNRRRHYLAGFLTGYAEAVADRIIARRAEVIDATPGADLVLADRQRAVDNLYAARLKPHTHTGAAQTTDADGTSAGYAAGQHADLSDPGIGTTRRAIGN